MRVLLTDLRHAWRGALRQPVVTLSIIALLALGVGGVTAVFNPIDTDIWRCEIFRLIINAADCSIR